MSWEPRILVVDGFLSEVEADEMHTLAHSMDFQSTNVVCKNGSGLRLNGTVTSTIANFPPSHDVVRRVKDRIAELSGLPTHWSEPLRGLHYSPGAFFRGHLDSHQHTHQRTSTRVATCLLYLNDVGDGDGGETHFPFAVSATGEGESAPPACRGFESKDPSVQSAEALDAYEDGSELHSVQELLGEPRGALGVTVRPRKGRAVLWWNRDADGALALRSGTRRLPTAARDEGGGDTLDALAVRGCAPAARGGLALPGVGGERGMCEQPRFHGDFAQALLRTLSTRSDVKKS